MSSYKRLSYEERVKISLLLEQGKSQTEISNEIVRSRSTICREFKNFKGIYYFADIAQKLSDENASKRCKKHNKIIDYPLLEYYILLRMRQGWSPAQISNRLKSKHNLNPRMQISHESIYTYIYFKAKGELKKELISYLRQEKAKRKKPLPHAGRKEIIPDRIGIEHRPEEVQDRIIPGHWESDLMIGKDQKSAIVTMVERTTRYVKISKIKNRTAKEVRKVITQEMLELPEYMRKTMTHDNGIEMAEHKLLTKQTNLVVYFAHPYSPWERGTNENTNMLIRDFFPKGTDFNQIPSGKIKYVQELLNNRPRKTLGWQTPNEVFNDYIVKGKAGISFTKEIIKM